MTPVQGLPVALLFQAQISSFYPNELDANPLRVRFGFRTPSFKFQLHPFTGCMTLRESVS